MSVVLNKWSICCYFRLLTAFWLFFRQTNTFGLYTAHWDVYSAPHSGSVAERLKAPVLKTGDPKGFQSSNLCASARLNKGLPKGNPFVFWAVGIQLEYPVGTFVPRACWPDSSSTRPWLYDSARDYPLRHQPIAQFPRRMKIHRTQEKRLPSPIHKGFLNARWGPALEYLP